MLLLGRSSSRRVITPVAAGYSIRTASGSRCVAPVCDRSGVRRLGFEGLLISPKGYMGLPGALACLVLVGLFSTVFPVSGLSETLRRQFT
jgi:hypothetical protein